MLTTPRSRLNPSALAAAPGSVRGAIARGRLHGHAGRAHPPVVIWLPALLVGAALTLPLVYLVMRASQAGAGVSDLVFRPRTALILRNTVLLGVSVAGATALVAMPLAWLTTRTDLPLRRAWAIVAALPLVVPSYVGALTVVAALGPEGLLRGALPGPLGLTWLPQIYGFFGAWLALTLFSYPYVFLSVRAALRGLDPALDEAARGLGYGAWRTFFRCTLPQLRPAIASGALLAALYAVSDFGVVSLLRYDALTRAIYVQYRGAFDRSFAAVLGLLLVLVAGGLVIAEGRIRGRAAYYRIGGGAARGARPVPLGHWRYPALAYCAALVALSLGLPLGVLGYWFRRGLSAGRAFDGLQSVAVHSVSVGAWTAVAATLAALPVAILAVRFPGRLGTLAERTGYLGYALPGIVVALAFVYFGANYLTPLYQTLPLLILAYTLRFLPQAIGAGRTALLQISPRLEEAARNLGRSPLGATASVTVPLAKTGLAAGAALVFLTVVEELPMTLLLAPTGYDTLATSIWQSANTAAYAQAAGPALILIAVSIPPTLLLIAGGRRRRPARGRL